MCFFKYYDFFRTFFFDSEFVSNNEFELCSKLEKNSYSNKWNKKKQNEYSYSKLEEIHIKILWVCASFRVLNKQKKIISIFTSTKYRIVWQISNIWHLKNVKCNKLCYFRHVLNQLSQQSWHCVFFACRESDPSIEKSHF